jgi:hypothetical protein
MPKTGTLKKPLRARDIAGKRFASLEKNAGNPEFLIELRNNQRSWLLEFHVEDVAKRLNLDPGSTADRELLLRLLAQVHSRYQNVLTRFVNRRGPGRSRKWGTEQEHLALIRDIRVAWKDKTQFPSIPKLAELLKAKFPSKYAIDVDTLTKQLRNHFNRRRSS